MRYFYIPMVALLVLSACSSMSGKSYGDSATPMYYKDGRAAFITRCTGPNWGECLEVAGNECKANGYEILEANASRAYPKYEQEMIFACKSGAK